MYSFRFCKEVYVELLPVFLPSSTLVGFMTGLTALSNKNKSVDLFTDLIGFTSLGIITGITYPVSFPLLSVYVLYKNK